MNRNPLDPLATRPTLLHRIQNTTDQESWRVFYDLYSGLVYRFALQHGLTDAEAQDVVQDTFVAVAKAIPEFKYNPSVGSFRSWMLHTTQWRIYDQYKRRGPQQSGAAAFGADDSPSTAALEQVPDESTDQLKVLWDREWCRNLVEAALQRVKPRISAKQFQVFDLYVLKAWPALKIARALNVGVGHVYLAKHRVAKLIKQEVKQLESQSN